jgi:hypothetical protein
MIDQADYNTQQIFFDDNAEYMEDCIIDCRDVVTGKQIPYDKFIDMYVVMVHPTNAIMEMDYFIKKIEQAETKRDEEIARAEAGIEDEDQNNQSILGGASQAEESEWE